MGTKKSMVSAPNMTTSINKKMLITGVSGLLGNNLAYYFEKKRDVLGLYNDHPVIIRGIRTEKCNLNNTVSLEKIIKTFNPNVIIHCASLANVDECEKQQELAKITNVLFTKNLVGIIQNLNTRLIYISTDSVYDGIKGKFSEKDTVHPLNVYARTKFEGELAALEREGCLVLRTNLFGWNIQEKKSLGEWILGELEAGKPIKGFHDAVFSTIYTMELARVIDLALQKGLKGIYNCGSRDACSKYEFALKIADRFGCDRQLIQPISIDDFYFQAQRGKNLSLQIRRLEEQLDYHLPSIDQCVDEFYRDFKCGLPMEIKNRPARVNVPVTWIPYGRQWVDENDIQTVVQTLRAERITQGPRVEEFEESLAEYCGAKFAVVVNSGTSALHIACLAAGVQPGDEVITSPVTFVASANCAVYCGAKPVFADIDPRTYNIAPEEIREKFSSRTKAVIPVHLAGQICDMDSIQKTVRLAAPDRKVFIIEDACHALGSFYRGGKVGSCTWADMTVLSFHPVKHITTGEGGAVLTNDESLCRKLRLFRSHGITSDPKGFINKDLAFPLNDSRFTIHDSPNPWYYEQIDLGYNYRITDIQSALGLSQLKKIDAIHQRRREIVNRYNETFSGLDHVRTPYELPECDSNFHLYILLIDFAAIGIERSPFMSSLREKGIQTQVHYIPVHLQPFFREHFGTAFGDCPKAEAYYERCLSLPLYPALCDQEIKRVIGEVKMLIQSDKKGQ